MNKLEEALSLCKEVRIQISELKELMGEAEIVHPRNDYIEFPEFLLTETNRFLELTEYFLKENLSRCQQHVEDTDTQDIPLLLENTESCEIENYCLPTIDLLKDYNNESQQFNDMAEQTAKKKRVVEVLRTFGIEISSIKATIGPTVTLYEITLAPGVSIRSVRSHEDDIALSLSSLGIRIISTIPDKTTIGIEVPNDNPAIVSMKSILSSWEYQESVMELPCAIGKTITNEVFMFDLTKAPHLLVAGATGQGKTVGLTAIITSLLYKKRPSELKFVLIDSKGTELSIYAPLLSHFFVKLSGGDAHIITDNVEVVRTLNSLCKLMDTRYDLLREVGASNIKEYNQKYANNGLSGRGCMPYIVVVIDEFGLLMMNLGKKFELPIARIAQLARAVGIHMVITTQSPTTSIITGSIKANFPTRIAFKVCTSLDSKIILDQVGAQQLIGNGDMLYFNGTEPIRVQGAYVDNDEIMRINEFVASQSVDITSELSLPDTTDVRPGDEGCRILPKGFDPLFEDAARLVVKNQSGSTSLIQRKFAIGYNRAVRLMDQLEEAGVVGAEDGSKPRDVLVQDETGLNNFLITLGYEYGRTHKSPWSSNG